MAPRAGDASLRKQFEVQSQNFAAVLTDLQQLTLELAEQRATTQQQIDEATAASQARAEEMEKRADQMEERAEEAERQVAAKEEQRATEVTQLGEVLRLLRLRLLSSKAGDELPARFHLIAKVREVL